MPITGDLLEPEFAEPFRKWKAAPGPQSNAAMLKTVRPIMDSALSTYGGGTPSPMLRGQAKLLTLDGLKNYDPAKGPLKQHLFSQLRRLQRINAQQQQVIQLPEQVALDRRHLSEAEKNLADELGRDPSDAEIADYTGLSLKRLRYVRQAQAPINAGRMIREEADGAFEPASVIPGQHDAEDAWLDLVYDDLGPVDQAIMDHSFGLRGKPKLPVTEIARRLGVTPSAISQRSAKIQRMLDERYTTGGL